MVRDPIKHDMCILRPMFPYFLHNTSSVLLQSCSSLFARSVATRDGGLSSLRIQVSLKPLLIASVVCSPLYFYRPSMQGVLNLTAHSEAAQMATIRFSHVSANLSHSGINQCLLCHILTCIIYACKCACQAQLEGMQLQSNPCLDRKSLATGIIKPKVRIELNMNNPIIPEDYASCSSVNVII